MQYLLAALGLAPLSIFLWALFMRQKKTPRIVREKIPGLSLRLSHSGGIMVDLSFAADRIRCGFSPDYEIDLAHYEKAGRTTGKTPVEEMTFQLADGRLAVTSRNKVMMNGVERTSGSIPVGGSLLFKTCRFTFLGQTELQKETSVFPDTTALGKLAAAPAAASLVTVIMLILGLANLGTAGFFQRPEPGPAIAREQPVQPAPVTAVVPVPAVVPEPAPRPITDRSDPAPVAPIPEPVPAPVPVPVKKPVVVPSRSAVRPEPIKPLPERITTPAAASPAPAVQPKPTAMVKPAPEPEFRALPTLYPSPRMVSPGEPIPNQRVDVLFIHAHPDDESIDFGTLMALCRGAGLTTATVLMTDGEGGIYQQDYAGPRDNMVATRVQEATKAMQFLGTSLYIRLGLPNSPYNSLLEEKGVQEVLRLWNGEVVADQLAGIMNTLGPKVVVSPEGPSFAREHFEHETTGMLTLMALQQLRRAGGHVPEAHLVSVDPRQKDGYTNLIAFPRQRVKERQRQALLSHGTQADATYFGVQIIEKYQEEYYLIQYWNLAIHFSNFFGIATGQHRIEPEPGGTFLVQHSAAQAAP